MSILPTISILLLAATVSAQSPSGRLTGRVTDSANALVGGAAVRAVHLETNVANTTTTNHEGVYDILNLIAGTYRIEVEMAGFKRYERGPVEVRVGDVLNLDLALQLGSMTESITVTGQTPLLESATASLGQTMDNRRLADLPMSGGNANYLMQLAPGVISTNAPMHGWLPQAKDSVSNLATDGTRTRSSEFTLDGIPNMMQSGQIAFVVPPELIQEMQVRTASYDASVGHFTGAHVNMVIKSGANKLHGSLWFSHLSRPLMSLPFFVNRSFHDLSTGLPTKEKLDSLFPPTKTNRYRATVSGPVLIPKVYDGRNRTFFTYGNDFMLRTFSGSGFNTVPTAAERRGDFSSLLAIGGNYQIYDPGTIASAANGRFSRLPLAGNVIPSARLDPIAQKLLSNFPLPNVTGTIDGRNNYSTPPANRIDYAAHVVRIDQVVSQNNRFYGSFSMSSIQGDQGRSFRNDALGSVTDSQYRGIVLDDVHTLRSNLILNFRYGLTRLRNTSRPPSLGYNLASLGLAPGLVNQVDPALAALPIVAVDGYTTFGTDSGSLGATTFHFFGGNATFVRGEHSLRFGGEFRILQDNNYGYGSISPSYTFSTNWTKGPLDSSPASPIGQGLASMLLGLPTSGYIDRNTSFAEESNYMGIFLQDDWKITRKLTLNIGLRYELELPTTERYNRSNRGFDFTTVNPIQDAARAQYAKNPIAEVPVSQFNTPGGLLFAGVNGQPRGLWSSNTRNFSPRFGLAWRALPNTVIRAGYGIFFENLGADRNDVIQQGFTQRTSLTSSLDNGLSFRGTLANPFPDGILLPAGASAGLRTFLGRGPTFFTPDRPTGYMQRWSFNIQRQFGQHLLIELGYTGNRGTHLGLGGGYDPVPAQYLSTLGVRDQPTIDKLTKAVPNPFFGLPDYVGSDLQGSTVAYSQLLRPFPQFNGVSSTTSDGFSWYHAMNVRAEKRFSQGYTLSLTYTWSKFMEAVERLQNQDPGPQHVISPQDRPHHTVLSGIWELPVGRGRRLVNTRNPLFNGVVGGWSIQGIYQWQSGAPIDFGDVILRNTYASLVLPWDQRTTQRWFNIDAGFERNSSQQLAQDIRTFPLRLSNLRAGNWNNWDLSLFKSFRIRERMNFQIRAEANDALNHAMFNAPNAAPANTLFGTVNNTIWSEQRKITIAGKLVW